MGRQLGNAKVTVLKLKEGVPLANGRGTGRCCMKVIKSDESVWSPSRYVLGLKVELNRWIKGQVNEETWKLQRPSCLCCRVLSVFQLFRAFLT